MLLALLRALATILRNIREILAKGQKVLHFRILESLHTARGTTNLELPKSINVFRTCHHWNGS
jgi:hypothetical protein